MKLYNTYNSQSIALLPRLDIHLIPKVSSAFGPNYSNNDRLQKPVRDRKTICLWNIISTDVKV